MKTYHCDNCGSYDATKKVYVDGKGSCGDSFCWSSCDLRSCKGATYDWCGIPECAAKMKSDMFVPLNLRKSNDDDVDLRSIIEPARHRRAAAAKEELLSVKKFIAEKIAEAVECGKCVVQLIPKHAVLHNDPDVARITHFVEVIGKHEDEIVEWLARNDVRIETFRNNPGAAGYNVVWDG